MSTTETLRCAYCDIVKPWPRQFVNKHFAQCLSCWEEEQDRIEYGPSSISAFAWSVTVLALISFSITLWGMSLFVVGVEGARSVVGSSAVLTAVLAVVAYAATD